VRTPEPTRNAGGDQKDREYEGPCVSRLTHFGIDVTILGAIGCRVFDGFRRCTKNLSDGDQWCLKVSDGDGAGPNQRDGAPGGEESDGRAKAVQGGAV